MSLKAYDGMMTKNGFSYLQEKIKEKLPEFKEASKNKLGSTIASYLISHIDERFNVKTDIEVLEITDKNTKIELENIKTDDILLINYLWKCAEVLSKSFFTNNFCTYLNLTIESKGDKILIYPNILVKEHKEILLSFLTDWYCQDQSDPNENVPEDEWDERSKDWYTFDEVRGLKTRITLFDPNYHWDNLIQQIRGEEYLNLVLSKIPSDDERKKDIWYSKFLDKKISQNTNTDKSNFDKYFEAHNFIRTDEGKKEYEIFKLNNPIQLTKIDLELLNTYKLNV